MICRNRLIASGALFSFALLFLMPAQAAYTDNGDGTVTDTATSLIWDKCPWGQSNNTNCSVGSATSYSWAAALGVAVSANSSNWKGHNDWRLPNKNELDTLTDLSLSNPAIDTTAFPNTYSDRYWSSTSFTEDLALAYFLDFSDGGLNAISKTLATANVRLVRSGQPFAAYDPQPAPPVVAAVAPSAIPTLSEWGLILLAGLLGLFGMGAMRRHSISELA